MITLRDQIQGVAEVGLYFLWVCCVFFWANTKTPHSFSSCPFPSKKGFRVSADHFLDLINFFTVHLSKIGFFSHAVDPDNVAEIHPANALENVKSLGKMLLLIHSRLLLNR